MPENIQQQFHQALELQQKGDMEGAVAAYRRLLAMRPDVPAAHANLGVALAKVGRYPEAIENYKAALEREEDPATRLNLGLAYYKTNDLTHAAPEFERVRTEQPGNVQAEDLAADCYLRMGDNKRVIEIARPIAAARPDDLSVQYVLGTALIRDHRKKEGRQVIERVMQHGENAGANLLKAQLALADEDYVEANSRAAQAIAEAPQLPDAYVLSGMAEEGLGDDRSAEAAFRRSLELDPNEFDANLQLGALLARGSEPNQSRSYLSVALRTRPNSPDALYQMGLVDKLTGNLDEARKAFEAAEKYAPDWAEPRVQLAALYYRLHRPQDGLREREAVSRLSAHADQR